MKIEAVGKILEKKVVQKLQDLGKDIGAYKDMAEMLGMLLGKVAVKAAMGEDVSSLAADLAAVSANLASATQAISVREIEEFIEEALKEGAAIIKELIRLAA